MLDDLIRQMPGVTLNEAGQIFVNGRMVDELMLGSRSFMKGNKQVLMENLPYYTVKDIKVYDRQSDKSKAISGAILPTWREPWALKTGGSDVPSCLASPTVCA